jgi:hypothetical protein
LLKCLSKFGIILDHAVAPTSRASAWSLS